MVNITNNPLKVLYWNANGVRLKIPEMKTLVLKEEIDVVLLNETHLKNFNSFILNIPGYVLYHTERTFGAKGGTAVLIKQTIDHMEIKKMPRNIEATTVKINHENKDIVSTIV